jgi:flagellar motor switch protein FliN
MTHYIDCWTSVAEALFPQALAGEPQLVDSLPKPMPDGAFGFAATLTGDEAGRFSVILDPALLDAPLVGDGVDQRAGWRELLREVAEAAAGELLARTGANCRVNAFEEIGAESQISCAFQLKSGDRTWTILVRDDVRNTRVESQSVPTEKSMPQPLMDAKKPAGLAPGVELLLDVELEATLRFGCREMLLGEILDLGPGDVVELDRHVADPVDLIVSDKIVAQGEVVLVNGNFGLRVTSVAEPRKRLETIRCLF